MTGKAPGLRARDPWWVAGLIALAAQAAWFAGFLWPGVLLWTCGAGWWWRHRKAGASRPGGMLDAVWAGRWVAVVTLLGAVARGWRLRDFTPGVLQDEGGLGLCALALLRGEPVTSYLHVAEPLGIGLTALFLRWTGPDVVAVRAVSALVGTATIPAAWWMARAMAGPGVGLAAAVVLAASRWHILLSRSGLACVWVPLGICLAAGCLHRAWRSGNPWLWAGTGAALGATFHTYMPGRVLPAIFAIAIGGGLLADRGGARARLRGTGICVAAFLLVGALLGVYAIWRPDLVLGRLHAVEAETERLKGMGRMADVVRGLASLNVPGTGAMNTEYTLPAPPGSPAFGFVAAALWIPGLCILLFGTRGVSRLLFILLLCAGFAGNAFGGVHFRRMTPLLPVAVLAAGAGAVRWVESWPGGRGWRVTALAGLAAACVVSEDWRFGLGYPWRTDPGVLEWHFRVHEVRLAGRLREIARTKPLFLGPGYESPGGTAAEYLAGPTLFLVADVVQRASPGSFARIAARGGAAVFPVYSPAHLDLLAEVLPGGRLVRDPGAGSGSWSYAAYLLEGSALGQARLTWGEYAELDRLLQSATLPLVTDGPGAMLDAYARAAASFGMFAGTHALRATALLKAGRAGEAEREAEVAVRFASAGGCAWVVLGQCLEGRGEHLGAVEAFARAARRNPLLEAAWGGWVAALLNAGDDVQARRVLARAVEIFPRSAMLAPLGAALAATGP